MAKETIITIWDDDRMEVVTTSRKWSNRMDKLVQDGHAEEVESELTGRAYKMEASLLKMPFYREPREWSDEEREAARERMAKVREKSPIVQKGKAKSTPKPIGSTKADQDREKAKDIRALSRRSKSAK